jgi:uncharacterized protein YndB with AHSA1/START domain
MTTPDTPDTPNTSDTLDTGDGSRCVEQSVDVQAPIDEVWAALTDPAELGEWLGGEVDLDVRPEGSGRVVDLDGTVRDVLVTAVEHHRRIAWHWWDDRNGLSSVEVTVEELGESTRVSVLEMLVPSADDERRAVACQRRWARATGDLWLRLSAVARVTR